MNWLLRILILLFMSCCALTGAKGFAVEPIKIGLTLGLSGQYHELSLMQKRAYELWEEQTNKKGGILGRQVNLIIYDDESSTQNANKLYKKLITEDKVNFVFGPYSSEISLAAAKIADLYQYPTLMPGASSDRIWQQGYQYIFGMWIPASDYLLGFLQLLKIRHFSDIAVIYATDNFSQSIHNGLTRWATSLGFKTVYTYQLQNSDIDFDRIVNQVKQHHPQVLFVLGHFEESVNIRQALSRLQWSPSVYYSSVGPTLPKYYQVLGKDADLTFSSSNWEPHAGLTLPGSKVFIDDFKRKYNLEPSYHAATAYAAGVILQKAITTAGTTDRQKIRKILATSIFTTLIGRYGVDQQTGIQTSHFPLVIQWQKGKKEIVWPTTLRTQEPVF